MIMRFLLLEVGLAALALVFGYLGRKLLGRFTGGMATLVWGVVWGFLAMAGSGMLFAWLGVGFVDLGDNDLLRGAYIFIVRYWEQAVVGGVIGAVLGSIGGARRQLAKPKPLADHTPKA